MIKRVFCLVLVILFCFTTLFACSCSRKGNQTETINNIIENEVKQALNELEPAEEVVEAAEEPNFKKVEPIAEVKAIPEEAQSVQQEQPSQSPNEYKDVTYSALYNIEKSEVNILGNCIIIDSGTSVKIPMKGFNRLKFQMYLIDQNVDQYNIMVINTPTKTICRYMDFKPALIEDYLVWSSKNTPYITIQLVTTNTLNGEQVNNCPTKLVIVDPQQYRS